MITVWQVSAVNVNVSTPGTQLSVATNKVVTKPEAPETFTVEVLEKGVVNLSWPHPWRTGGHLEKFSIKAELISSNLRKDQSQSSRVYEHPVKEYRIQYSEQLHLLSASTYKISICGVTNVNVYGKEKIATVQTPLAMAFEKELTTNVSNADSTIDLRTHSCRSERHKAEFNARGGKGIAALQPFRGFEPSSP